MSIVKKDYLICYDISDERRLAKLARYLEKVSLRIQYSIFLLPKTTTKELQNIIDEMLDTIDRDADDLRVYTIKNSGYKAGTAVDLKHPFIIT